MQRGLSARLTEGLSYLSLELARFIEICFYNPSVTRSARHPPLHKEGFIYLRFTIAFRLRNNSFVFTILCLYIRQLKFAGFSSTDINALSFFALKAAS